MTQTDREVLATILDAIDEEMPPALEDADTDGKHGTEGDFPDENPTFETQIPCSGAPDNEADPFATAIRWFHRQLDRELPDEIADDVREAYCALLSAKGRCEVREVSAE